jgi:hypothetical protein
MWIEGQDVKPVPFIPGICKAASMLGAACQNKSSLSLGIVAERPLGFEQHARKAQELHT